MQRNKAGRTSSGHQFSRLKPAEIDPLAEYGLPSKGEKRLLNHKTQEAYYSKIAERYLAFCTDAGDRDSLQKQFSRLAIGETTSTNTSTPLLPAGSTSTPPSSSSSHSHEASTPQLPPPSDLSQILSALRKLREALVASSRLDDFTTQVYLFAVRLGILSSSFETYLPSLLYLLRVIHRSPTHPLTSVEYHEVVSYLVLDTACRRGDLAEAYALRNRYKLREPKVDATLKALVTDDWVSWRRTKRAVDGYRVKLMEFAEPGMRGHVLKAFGRAYLSVGVEYLEETMGMKWEDMVERFGVGWELNNGRVVIRKIGGKTQ
ncbi:uncharacterized protein B0T23DRAFT_385893 [Neurospora hispaniola]|uniref:CSN8/PSMD8/EIF3K domain-containing protein n=1 Tax=Neurospora hispaniola TaxID=588809 RepID=A0AAJ0I1M4_9PEZI|nr:hypothetical protein B0T23DRAFT_385893 [Neurospora hispaniola]